MWKILLYKQELSVGERFSSGGKSFFRAETLFGGRKVHLRKKDTSAEYKFFHGKRIAPGGKGDSSLGKEKISCSTKILLRATASCVGEWFSCRRGVLFWKEDLVADERFLLCKKESFCGRKDDM